MKGPTARSRRSVLGAAVAIVAAGAILAGCTNPGGGGFPGGTTTTMDHGGGGMDHGGGGMDHGGSDRLNHPPTAEQKAWAYRLIRDTAASLRGMTKARAIMLGYNDIGDRQHFTHPRYRHDGKEYDPSAIESLVFNPLTGEIQAAMYNLEPSTTMANVRDYAGNWIVYHDHTNLCWQSAIEGTPGYTRLAPCGLGGVPHPPVLMAHVWIKDSTYALQCGAFATITGLGEGSCIPALRPSVILSGRNPL